MTFPGAASPRTTRFASAATTSCLYGSGMAGGWRAGVYLALILHLDVQVKRSRRLRRQTLERRGGSALWRTGFCFASARIAARGRVSSRAKGCAAISPLSNVRAPLSLQRGTGAHRNTQFHIIDCALCPSLESGAFAGWHLTAPSFVPSPLPTRVSRLPWHRSCSAAAAKGRPARRSCSRSSCSSSAASCLAVRRRGLMRRWLLRLPKRRPPPLTTGGGQRCAPRQPPQAGPLRQSARDAQNRAILIRRSSPARHSHQRRCGEGRQPRAAPPLAEQSPVVRGAS